MTSKKTNNKMNAIEFISYLTANDLLIKHTAESAYKTYVESNLEEPSSFGFFTAKFNAKKRKLGLPLEIITERNEVNEAEASHAEFSTDQLKELEDKEIIEVTIGTEPEKSNGLNPVGIIKEEIQLDSKPEPCQETIDHINERVSKAKEETITPVIEDKEVSLNSVIEDQEEEETGELKLKVTRYNEGKELPELPGLIPTGTLFDSVICDRITSDEDKGDIDARKWERGGFTRKCCDVVAGGAGSGKTYSRTMLACMAKQINPKLKIGFVCGEMREVEWIKEVHSAPILAELEVVYMLNYVGQSNYEKVFYEACSMYDIVIVDSFPAIISHIKMSPGERRTDKAITFDLIREINLSVDKYNYNMQLINQATKDGNYKGGTELPHMMSSQSFVRVDGQQRYMEYEKNRNNGNTIKRKLYFSKNSVTGMLEFNEEVYKSTYEQKEDIKQDLNDFFANQEQFENSIKDNEESRLSPIDMSDEEMSDKGDQNVVVSNQLNLLDSIEEIEETSKQENNYV